MNQRGAVPILPIVIAAALGVGLAASMYLNYAQYQRAQDDKRLLQGTISDLKYQVAQDQANGTLATPTPSASVTPSPSATPTPGAVAGSQSLAITELGVKVTTSTPVADLTYAVIPSQTAGATVVRFQSPAFLAKYPSCADASPLGQLVRRPVSQRAPAGNVYVATIGGYKFYFYNPGNTCAVTPEGKADVAAAIAALNGTILKTITQ